MQINEARDHELNKVLLAGRVSHFRVTGGSRDRMHTEPGWGCELPLNEALGLARQFGQAAIYWVELPMFYLVSCEGVDPQQEPVAQLSHRWCPME